jgi:hypothetical protein
MQFYEKCKIQNARPAVVPSCLKATDQVCHLTAHNNCMLCSSLEQAFGTQTNSLDCLSAILLLSALEDPELSA